MFNEMFNAFRIAMYCAYSVWNAVTPVETKRINGYWNGLGN